MIVQSHTSQKVAEWELKFRFAESRFTILSSSPQMDSVISYWAYLSLRPMVSTLGYAPKTYEIDCSFNLSKHSMSFGCQIWEPTQPTVNKKNWVFLMFCLLVCLRTKSILWNLKAAEKLRVRKASSNRGSYVLCLLHSSPPHCLLGSHICFST